MKFLIISHVEHSQDNGKVYGYGPYIKEMNLWLKHVDKVRIVAPIQKRSADAIDLAYEHQDIRFDKVPSFNLLTKISKVKTLLRLPLISLRIFIAMLWADHIHLRCPGNMGLLGAVVQILFPWKIKTVKYAGNWDPDSKQPLSYRLQKKIISNPFVSKNMKVLVYGQWPNQSTNIVNFFTATYKDIEKEKIDIRSLDKQMKIVFVGALSPGKRPIIAVEAIHKLKINGMNVHLDIMGEGPERNNLEQYIKEHDLAEEITLHGNQSSTFVKEKFKQSNFLILMSKSEGWPKVVAEAMFWGSVPITTNVSCVDYMIGSGSRGSLVEPDSISVSKAIENYSKKEDYYKETASNALEWSRQFTLESFENEIVGVLNA